MGCGKREELFVAGYKYHIEQVVTRLRRNLSLGLRKPRTRQNTRVHQFLDLHRKGGNKGVGGIEGVDGLARERHTTHLSTKQLG